MYLWKCWCEYGRLAAGFLLLFVIMALAGDHMTIGRLPHVDFEGRRFLGGESGWPHNERTHRAMDGLTLQRQQIALQSVMHDLHEINIDLLVLAGVLGALFLGNAGSVAAEFDGRTEGLLFTRPRSRRRLLWSNWATGIAMLEAVLLMTALLSSAYCCLRLPGIYPPTDPQHAGPSWVILLMRQYLMVLAAMLPIHLLLFGISTLGSIAGRGASKGTICAVLALVLYVGLYLLLRLRFGWHTPDWWFDHTFDWLSDNPFYYEGGGFAWRYYVLWLLLPLTLPWAAQKLLEGRDVA